MSCHKFFFVDKEEGRKIEEKSLGMMVITD